MEELGAVDLLVGGTGLCESVLSSASASIERRVLHVDRGSFYGGSWAAMPLKDIVALVEGRGPAGVDDDARQAPPPPPPSESAARELAEARLREQGIDPARLELVALPVAPDRVGGVTFVSQHWRAAEGSANDPGGDGAKGGSAVASGIDSIREDLLRRSRHFSIDLTPSFVLAAGPAVEVMVRSQVGRYLEFRHIDATYCATDADARARRVPTSRTEVFADATMPLAQKRAFMRVIEAVAPHGSKPETKESKIDAAAAATTTTTTAAAATDSKSSEVAGFVDFLRASGVNEHVRDAILYGVLMSRRDECGPAAVAAPLSLSAGLARLRSYVASLGRYGKGALLYPVYGCGEAPQGFCRLAAVKGAVFMLRVAPVFLAFDGASLALRGAVLSTGAFVRTERAVLAPEYVPHAVSTSPSLSRCVCVCDGPLLLDDGGEAASPQALLVVPPGSCASPIRVLQLSSQCAVCPEGLFVLHLSCVHAAGPMADLAPVLRTLVDLRGVQGLPRDEAASPARAPRALWICFYTQLQRKLRPDAILPHGVHVVDDAAVDCEFDECVQLAERRFRDLWGDAPFLASPEASSKKPTHFEEDPEGLASLSDDEPPEPTAASGTDSSPAANSESQ